MVFCTRVHTDTEMYKISSVDFANVCESVLCSIQKLFSGSLDRKHKRENKINRLLEDIMQR